MNLMTGANRGPSEAGWLDLKILVDVGTSRLSFSPPMVGLFVPNPTDPKLQWKSPLEILYVHFLSSVSLSQSLSCILCTLDNSHRHKNLAINYY